MTAYFRCSNICRHYKYSVHFDGIGKGPNGSENLGACSQAAIFVNQKMSSKPSCDDVNPTLYKLVSAYLQIQVKILSSLSVFFDRVVYNKCLSCSRFKSYFEQDPMWESLSVLDLVKRSLVFTRVFSEFSNNQVLDRKIADGLQFNYR